MHVKSHDSMHDDVRYSFLDRKPIGKRELTNLLGPVPLPRPICHRSSVLGAQSCCELPSTSCILYLFFGLEFLMMVVDFLSFGHAWKENACNH